MKIFNEKDLWESYKRAVFRRQKIKLYENGGLILPSFLENLEFVSEVINMMFKNLFGVDLGINPNMSPEEFFNKVYPYLRELWNRVLDYHKFLQSWVWIAKWIKLKGESPKKYLKKIREE